MKASGPLGPIWPMPRRNPSPNSLSETLALTTACQYGVAKPTLRTYIQCQPSLSMLPLEVLIHILHNGLAAVESNGSVAGGIASGQENNPRALVM
jgi:hypothetical protein